MRDPENFPKYLIIGVGNGDGIKWRVHRASDMAVAARVEADGLLDIVAPCDYPTCAEAQTAADLIERGYLSPPWLPPMEYAGLSMDDPAPPPASDAELAAYLASH